MPAGAIRRQGSKMARFGNAMNPMRTRAQPLAG
jgi:hypothetical protein